MAPTTCPSTTRATPPPKTTRRGVLVKPCTSDGSPSIIGHHEWVGMPPKPVTVHALSAATCADRRGAWSIRAATTGSPAGSHTTTQT